MVQTFLSSLIIFFPYPFISTYSGIYYILYINTLILFNSLSLLVPSIIHDKSEFDSEFLDACHVIGIQVGVFKRFQPDSHTCFYIDIYRRIASLLIIGIAI